MFYNEAYLSEDTINDILNLKLYKAFRENLKTVHALSDEQLYNEYKSRIDADERFVTPPKWERDDNGKVERVDRTNAQKKPLRINLYYMIEARIKKVFPYEVEMLIRSSDSKVTEEDILPLFYDELRALNKDQSYYGKAAGRSEEYDVLDHIDAQDDSTTSIDDTKKSEGYDAMGQFDAQDDSTELNNDMEESESGEDTSIFSTQKDKLTVEGALAQKEYDQWLSEHFPMDKYIGNMEDGLILKLFDWLHFVSQIMTEEIFKLDVKSVHVLALVAFRRMLLKDIAAQFGETPSATSRRMERIVKQLYGRSKEEIKEERKLKYRHWQDRKKAAEKERKAIKAKLKAERDARHAREQLPLIEFIVEARRKQKEKKVLEALPKDSEP
ncbi:MAG: hypothetical protein IKG01_10085 [Lachnospiraceae bacterium]|nr:hypothetical protein [Lachnospiraceae bacterium]